MTAADTDKALQKAVNPAKTRKGKKILLAKEPQIIENDKQTMILKGAKTSGMVNDVLADMYKIRRQNTVMMAKSNPFLPFEDTQPLLDLLAKKDTSMFLFGSHNKKRPHNLVFGRTYDGQMLDMLEFGVTGFKKLCQFKQPKIPLGAKPCLIFNGDMFERYPEWGVVQNYLCDFFNTTKTSSINLQGLEYVLSFTACEPNILMMRSYEVNMKQSGTSTPYVELEEIGISLDLILRRTQIAAPEIKKLSLKQPKAAKIGKTKNITHDLAGSKLATVHMTKQNLQEMPQSRMKGSRKPEDGEKKKKKKKVKESGDEGAGEEVEAMETS